VLPLGLQQKLGCIIGEHYPNRVDQVFQPPRRQERGRQKTESWTEDALLPASKHARGGHAAAAADESHSARKQSRRWKQQGA
jgi:hypothetical protein